MILRLSLNRAGECRGRRGCVLPIIEFLTLHSVPLDFVLLCFSRYYEFCRPPEAFIGGEIWLYHPETDQCQGPVQFGRFVGNPPVNFEGIDEQTLIVNNLMPMLQIQLQEVDVDPVDVAYYATKKDPKTAQRIVLNRRLLGPLCSRGLEAFGPVPIVFAKFRSHYWIHDSRFVLEESTLEYPLLDGGASLGDQSDMPAAERWAVTSCANVPRTWQNEASCKLSQDAQVCGRVQASQNQQLNIVLDSETLRSFYSLTKGDREGPRYIYAVEGLRLEHDPEAPPPCQPLARSRWMPMYYEMSSISPISEAQCLQNSAQQPQTLNVLTHLLAHANHGGWELTRDIVFPARAHTMNATCHAKDVNAKGFAVYLNGLCWMQVHPDHLQVFDFTDYAESHQGGEEHITQIAQGGSEILNFPSSHDMQQWQILRNSLLNLGTYRQTIEFGQLPFYLQASPSIVEAFFPSSTDSVPSSNALGKSVVVCGSPGEVANDLSKGGETLRGAFSVYTDHNNTSGDNMEDKETVWIQVALTAQDQLRQRMAWALSQILVSSTPCNAFQQIQLLEQLLLDTVY